MANTENSTIKTPLSRQRTVNGDLVVKENDLPNPKNKRLSAYYQKAWDIYQSLPFPTRLDEAWRRTDLRELEIQKLKPSLADKKTKNVTSIATKQLLKESYSGQIHISEKYVQTFFNETSSKQGVVFSDLVTAETHHADLLANLIGQVVKPEDGKFAALASALAQDGVLLYVPKGVRLEAPFYVRISGTKAFSARITRLLIWLEEGASITLILDYESHSINSKAQALHAGITEINLEQDAQLNFIETQSWGEHVWSFMHDSARVRKDGKLNWITGVLGSHVSKKFVDVDLIEPGAEAKMSGFYISTHDQHFDIDTQQNHLASNTISDLLYKGVLLGQSKAIWQGMIYVAPHAVKIDGFQTNNNLILSSDAKANSIPGLEILADDVSCSHGATVSNIDETEMFYLQSRGISANEAEALITKGFLHSIFGKIEDQRLIKRLTKAIDKKIVR